MTLTEITHALNEAGLDLRGAFHPGADDAVPPVAAGIPARTLVLAGNAGPRMFARFGPEHAARGLTLDAWSLEVLGPLAAGLGARAVFPFERPWLPFQRWARRAEPCHASPLGLLVHPDHGLWHGYRGALLFAECIDLPPPDLRPSPCDACAARPCLSACPVGAFSASGYDVPACARHLAGNPEPACMQKGCLARHACPASRGNAYVPAQARFHMTAFLRNHRPA